MLEPRDIIQKARIHLPPEDVNFVLYHSPCADGFGSALVSHKVLGDSATYIPMAYEKPITDFSQFRGQNVLIVDFSLSEEDLGKLKRFANTVLILDHHISAQKRLTGIDGCFFDMGHSGAYLALEYFYELLEQQEKLSDEFVEVVKLIEDRDIWKWEFKDRSKAFAASLSAMIGDGEDSFYFDFTKIDSFCTARGLRLAIREGNKILIKEKEWVDRQASHAVDGVYTDLSGRDYKIKIYEGKSYYLFSEIGHSLCQDDSVDFAMLWYQQNDGTFKVSLRSEKTNIDVSKIAEEKNGGGHRAAAGFSTNENPMELLSSNVGKLDAPAEMLFRSYRSEGPELPSEVDLPKNHPRP